jgi:homoserine kinase
VANLGPGFDALGMAVNLFNAVELEEDGGPAGRVEVSGEGESTLPRDGSNLVAAAVSELFRRTSYESPGWKLRLTNNIPLQRGLGSSAAAIVGGLIAANALAGSPCDREQILRQAIELEGHPDNVAAALLGGVVVVVRGEAANGAAYLYSSFCPPAGLAVAAVVPGYTLATSLARSILPKQVPLADAVFNLGRVALLISALREGNWQQLQAAVQDRLHQPYRSRLVPGLEDMFRAALQAGAFGAFLSGAGPTVIALGPPGSPAGEEIRKIFLARGTAAEVLHLQPSPEGARIIDE